MTEVSLEERTKEHSSLPDVIDTDRSDYFHDAIGKRSRLNDGQTDFRTRRIPYNIYIYIYI